VKRLLPFFLLLLPVALAAEKIPALPGLYWGDVNATCDLKKLAPGVTVRAEYNGAVLDSIALSSEGNNLFRFGGPSSSDDKLLVSGIPEGADFNLALYYSSNVGPLVIGSEDYNAGEVKYLYFELNSSQCSSLFPSATYHVSLSLPSDCNGSFSGTTLYVYYGGSQITSKSLSGDKSASADVTVNGYAHGIPEGASITFKVCKGDNCDSTSTSYNYGEDADISFSVSCSALFSSSSSAEGHAASGGESGSEEQGGSAQASSRNDSEATSETEEMNVTVSTDVSGPPEVPVPPDEQNKSVVENVVETLDRGTRRILGLPPDVALIIAVLVVIVIIVAIRFIL